MTSSLPELISDAVAFEPVVPLALAILEDAISEIGIGAGRKRIGFRCRADVDFAVIGKECRCGVGVERTLKNAAR